MLAYYVEWHMREALAPLLFQDEEVSVQRTNEICSSCYAISIGVAEKKKSCK